MTILFTAFHIESTCSSVCFSGHTHFKNKFFNGNPLIYNVALDAHSNAPVSLDEAINDIKEALDNIKNNLDL